MKPVFMVLSALWALAMAACVPAVEPNGPQYSSTHKTLGVPTYALAVFPSFNPGELIRAFQPLIDYLNVNIPGARFGLEASRDYAAFEKKYLNRKPELLLPNPWQALQAMKVGYHVIAMVDDPRDFKGIIIVRRDGGINTPRDLIGKAVSFPSPTALAACVLPQYFLFEQGLDVNRDIKNRYVGSQESSIMNVYLGMTSAGATWPPAWRLFQLEHPVEASALEVKWETAPLINNAVMIRDDLPAAMVEQVRRYLVTLGDTREGRNILKGIETTAFSPASDKDYDSVRQFMDRFERAVRKVATQ